MLALLFTFTLHLLMITPISTGRKKGKKVIAWITLYTIMALSNCQVHKQTNKQKIRQMEASSNKSTSEAMLTRLLWYEKAQTLIVHYPLHCFYLK